MINTLLLVVASIAIVINAAPDAEKVDHLPGINSTTTLPTMYSGLLPVTETKALHYVFVLT